MWEHFITAGLYKLPRGESFHSQLDRPLVPHYLVFMLSDSCGIFRIGQNGILEIFTILEKERKIYFLRRNLNVSPRLDA